MKLKRFLTTKFIISIFIFCSTFSVYLFTLSHSVYFGDSGEYITVAKTLGVTHSPGYPLYTIIAWLFGKIPLSLNFATKINLLSAFFSALTLIVIYKTIINLTKNKIAAILTVLSLAFSYTFWLYSLVAEVFTMHLFFASLLFLLALTFNQTKSTKFFYLFSFFAGLSLTHHHTIILLFPAYLLLIFDKELIKNPKIISVSLALFTAGLLPYLYLPWAASQNPPYNWGDPKTPEQFFWVVLRKGYGTFSLSTQGHEIAFKPVILYFKSLFLGLGILSFFLFSSGILALHKKMRVLVSLLLAWTLSGPLFVIYSRASENNPNLQAVLERFFLLSLIPFIILIGIGINFILEKSKAINSWLSRLIILIIFLQISFLFFNHFPKTNQNKNDIYYHLGKNIFLSMEQNGVLLAGQDIGWMITHYLKYVEDQRSDIKLVNFSHTSFDWYLKLLQKNQDLKLPLYSPKNPTEANYICQNINTQTPIYIDGYSKRINPFINQKCQFIPIGVLVRLFPKDQNTDVSTVKKENDILWSSFSGLENLKRTNFSDARTREVLLYYSQIKDLLGRYYYKNNQEEWAKEEFLKAIEISQDNAEAFSHLAVIATKQQDYERAIELEEQAIKTDPRQETSYYNLGKLWLKKDPEKSKKYFEKFIEISKNSQMIKEVKDILENLN